MNHNMLFKPSDYSTWIDGAINKIIKTIDTSYTSMHIDSCRTMVDNFVMMLLLNDEYPEEDIIYISRQLYLYLEIKRESLNAF